MVHDAITRFLSKYISSKSIYRGRFPLVHNFTLRLGFGILSWTLNPTISNDNVTQSIHTPFVLFGRYVVKFSIRFLQGMLRRNDETRSLFIHSNDHSRIRRTRARAIYALVYIDTRQHAYGTSRGRSLSASTFERTLNFWIRLTLHYVSKAHDYPMLLINRWDFKYFQFVRHNYRWSQNREGIHIRPTVHLTILFFCGNKCYF